MNINFIKPFMNKKVSIKISTGCGGTELVREGYLTNYILTGAFFVLDDKVYIPFDKIICIEIVE